MKFITELPGSISEAHENGTVKIQFDNFDGQSWQLVMDFADSVTKDETDMKLNNLEGAPLQSHIVMNTCE